MSDIVPSTLQILSHSSSKQPCELSMMVPILQMRKLECGYIFCPWAPSLFVVEMGLESTESVSRARALNHAIWCLLWDSFGLNIQGLFSHLCSFPGYSEWLPLKELDFQISECTAGEILKDSLLLSHWFSCPVEHSNGSHRQVEHRPLRCGTGMEEGPRTSERLLICPLCQEYPPLTLKHTYTHMWP